MFEGEEHTMLMVPDGWILIESATGNQIGWAEFSQDLADLFDLELVRDNDLYL